MEILSASIDYKFRVSKEAVSFRHLHDLIAGHGEGQKFRDFGGKFVQISAIISSGSPSSLHSLGQKR